MTWTDLAKIIHNLPGELANTDVTVLCSECCEFLEADFHISNETTTSELLREHLDVLDANHPVLVTKHE
jgi:hypothetical protein